MKTLRMFFDGMLIEKKKFSSLCIFAIFSLSFHLSKGQEIQYFQNLSEDFLFDSIPSRDSGTLKFISISLSEFQKALPSTQTFQEKSEETYRATEDGFIIQSEKSIYTFSNDTNNRYSSFIQYAGYLPLLGCHVINHCGSGTCTDYLVDVSQDKRYFLPCSFDSGVLSMDFSPSGNFFLVASSYDGPEYEYYYDYRSEIYVFELNEKGTLEKLKLTDYDLGLNWSISDIVWLEEGVLGLEVFYGNRPSNFQGEDIKEKYSYFKAFTSK